MDVRNLPRLPHSSAARPEVQREQVRRRLRVDKAKIALVEYAENERLQIHPIAVKYDPISDHCVAMTHTYEGKQYAIECFYVSEDGDVQELHN